MSSPRPLEALLDNTPTPARDDDGGSGTPTRRRSTLFYLVGAAVFVATLLVGVIGIGRHRSREASDDAQARVNVVARDHGSGWRRSSRPPGSGI